MKDKLRLCTLDLVSDFLGGYKIFLKYVEKWSNAKLEIFIYSNSILFGQ